MKINNPLYYLPSSQLFPFSVATNSEIADTELLVDVQKAKEYAESAALDQALTLYNELIEKYPNLPFLYACRSIVKTHLNEEEGAFYDYQIAKRLDFNYHNVLEWMENSGEMVESDELEELVLKPKVEEQFYINRATLYVQHFDYIKAIEDFSTAYDFSNNPIVLISRGAVNMRLVRYDAALSDFNQALAQDDSLVQAYIYRAKLYSAIKEYELADNDFSRAIILSQEDSAVFEERAQFYELIEKWDLAIADYTRVILANPDDFYIYVLRADLYEKLGQLDNSLKDYNKAVELNPYYSDLYQYRGDIRKAMGDESGATDDYRKFEELEDE